MGKKKLTLSVNEDLLDEIKKIVAGEGRSISGIVEEYFEYLASTSWIVSLSEELGIGKLEPTTEREIPETRPKGLDAGKIVKQIRKNREERITHAL